MPGNEDRPASIPCLSHPTYHSIREHRYRDEINSELMLWLEQKTCSPHHRDFQENSLHPSTYRTGKSFSWVVPDRETNANDRLLKPRALPKSRTWPSPAH